MKNRILKGLLMGSMALFATDGCVFGGGLQRRARGGDPVNASGTKTATSGQQRLEVVPTTGMISSAETSAGGPSSTQVVNMPQQPANNQTQTSGTTLQGDASLLEDINTLESIKSDLVANPMKVRKAETQDKITSALTSLKSIISDLQKQVKDSAAKSGEVSVENKSLVEVLEIVGAIINSVGESALEEVSDLKTLLNEELIKFERIDENEKVEAKRLLKDGIFDGVNYNLLLMAGLTKGEKGQMLNLVDSKTKLAVLDAVDKFSPQIQSFLKGVIANEASVKRERDGFATRLNNISGLVEESLKAIDAEKDTSNLVSAEDAVRELHSLVVDKMNVYDQFVEFDALLREKGIEGTFEQLKFDEEGKIIAGMEVLKKSVEDGLKNIEDKRVSGIQNDIVTKIPGIDISNSASYDTAIEDLIKVKVSAAETQKDLEKNKAVEDAKDRMLTVVGEAIGKKPVEADLKKDIQEYAQGKADKVTTELNEEKAKVALVSAVFTEELSDADMKNLKRIKVVFNESDMKRSVEDLLKAEKAVLYKTMFDSKNDTGVLKVELELGTEIKLEDGSTSKTVTIDQSIDLGEWYAEENFKDFNNMMSEASFADAIEKHHPDKYHEIEVANVKVNK